MRYYIKATRENGVSAYDPKFRYQLGENVHPAPDRESSSACGEGIHLAKTVVAAKSNVSGAKEFYLATAGEILGEDSEKVRTDRCSLIRQLAEKELKDFDAIFRGLTLGNPLCGREWVEAHAYDVSWEDYYNQRMEISRPGGKHRVTLTPQVKAKKAIRTAVRAVLQS